MANRLLKVNVVKDDKDEDATGHRWINVADIHEAYHTTYTVNDEEHNGTMLERFVGATGATGIQHITIDETLSHFVTRFNALSDCPASPTPPGPTLNYRGEWTPGAVYNKLDYVTKPDTVSTYLAVQTSQSNSSLVLENEDFFCRIPLPLPTT